MADRYEKLVNSIFSLTRCLRRYPNPFLKNQSSLSMLQMYTLMYMKHHANPTMSEIAEEFGVALPTATKLVERLVGGGFIKRAPDRQDRRVVRMKLTQKGTQSLSQMKTQRDKQLKSLLSLLPDADIDDLQRIVDRLLLKLEQIDV